MTFITGFFFADNTKTRHSHNDVIFALVTSVRCHECSHRCVRYVFYFRSKPFRTSLRRSGHIAVLPCFVPCWVDKVLVESKSAEFANLLDIAETPAHPFCRGWGYSVQLCFSKGTDLIVIFDVQHLQVTRTELHSKLLAWHSLVCLVTSAEPLHRKVRYDWLGSFRPEAVWLAFCLVMAKTCFGIVGSCCDACR